MKQYHPIPAVHGVAYGVPDKNDTGRVNGDSIGRLPSYQTSEYLAQILLFLWQIH